jgi:hypothetical protein
LGQEMILRFYQDVQTVKKRALEGSQYVRICHGNKRGSIARVVDVKHITLSNHNFRLEITGCRLFWLKGKYLEYLPDYRGETKLVITDTPPDVHDMLGKQIGVGSVITFSKVFNPESNKKAELVVGVVKEIKINGSIMVQPIQATCDRCPQSLFAIRTNRYLILDRNLMSDLVMSKLTK